MTMFLIFYFSPVQAIDDGASVLPEHFLFPRLFPPFLSIASAVPCFCASWWNLRLWMLGATAVCQRPAALFQGCFCFSALWLPGWQTFSLSVFFIRQFWGLFVIFPFYPSCLSGWVTATAKEPSSLTLLCCHPMLWDSALPSASAWAQYSVVTPRGRFLHCYLMAAVFFVSGSWDNGQVLQRHKANKAAASLQPSRSETALRNKPQRRGSRLWRYNSNIPDNAKCLHSPAPQMSWIVWIPFTELYF